MQHFREDETGGRDRDQNKSIFVYLMLKRTTTVTDAKVVYRILYSVDRVDKQVDPGGWMVSNWQMYEA